MSIELWGRSTWILLHTLAEKVKEEHFLQIRNELFGMFLNLFANLPCPDCKQHALQFWRNVSMQKIMTKQQLIDVLWVFHNSVNSRTRHKQYKKTDLYAYKILKLYDVFKIFIKHFNTRGNEKLMADEEQRKRFLNSFIDWFKRKAGYFVFTAESLANAEKSILNDEQNVEFLKRQSLDKIKQLEKEIASLNQKTMQLTNSLTDEQNKLNELNNLNNTNSSTNSSLEHETNNTNNMDDELDDELSTTTSNLLSLAEDGSNISDDPDELSMTYDDVYDNSM